MAMTTETVWAALDALLDYAKNCGLLHPLDETFARNTLLSELRLESYEKQEQRKYKVIKLQRDFYEGTTGVLALYEIYHFITKHT